MPYMPLSHSVVERLINTIRREYLDHLLFWNVTDLERKHFESQDLTRQRLCPPHVHGNRLPCKSGLKIPAQARPGRHIQSKALLSRQPTTQEPLA